MMIPTCARFSEVSLKNVQTSMQKIITWIKKSKKGKQKWKNFCIIVGLLTRMLKSHVKTQCAS
jgi:hypothetical protein